MGLPGFAAADRPGPAPGTARGWWIALALVLVAVGLIRLRLTGVPLERDEGEYAYVAQLLLRGAAPYSHAYSMKWPGIYAAYASILTVFGETQQAIRLGLLLVNAVTSVLLFLVGRRLAGPAAGWIAASTFAVLALLPQLQGLFANAEHFVGLFVVAGCWALLRATGARRLAWLVTAALLLGTAPLMKQHGAVFTVMGGVYLLGADLVLNRLRPLRATGRVAIYAGFAAVPTALTCFVLLAAGAFESFWFWTVTYAREYSTQLTVAEGMEALSFRGARLFSVAPLLWPLAALGLAALLWDRDLRGRSGLVVLLSCASVLAVLPGLYFRPHYFILVLPAVSLATAFGVLALLRGLSRRIDRGVATLAVAGIVALALAWPLVHERHLLFRMDGTEVSRAIYGWNPFPESPAIAAYIAERTDPEDRIAVVGSEPQIYFYARRRAATGFIYTYALMENHEFAAELQDRMIREIEAAEPEFVVFVNVQTSWLSGPDSPDRLLKWFGEYQRRFRPVALVELSPSGSQWQWAPDTIRPPVMRDFVVLYRRVGRAAR